MRAYCLIRKDPVYRREAFVEGLKAAGYEVTLHLPKQPRPGEVLVIWNRYADNDAVASRFERAGGTVIVAENGYLDPGRYTDRRWYALAIGGHNGQGTWPSGEGRWELIAPRLGAEIRPWRTSGEHILVCPNRPFGRPGFIMPADFAHRTAAALSRFTQRPVRIRPHPGNEAPQVPLERDLERAWAVVIWASSAGVHALLAGIPVFCLAPAWILKAAACTRLEDVEFPPLPERQPAFERMAWAMWHVEEIARGDPFRHLLHHAREGEEQVAL